MPAAPTIKEVDGKPLTASATDQGWSVLVTFDPQQVVRDISIAFPTDAKAEASIPAVTIRIPYTDDGQELPLPLEIDLKAIEVTGARSAGLEPSSAQQSV